MAFIHSFKSLLFRGFFYCVLLALCSAMPALAAGQGLLWKVNAGEHAPISYLFGTIHADDPRVTELDDSVNQALHSASIFMMEVLPSNDMAPYLMPAPGLAPHLKPAELEQVQALAEQHGLEQKLALRMKPWLLAMVFDLPQAQSPYTLDVQLYLQAQQAGKQVQALEGMQEHFSALESLSLQEQIQMLRTVLARSQAQKEADFELLVQAYLSGDLARVAALDEQLSGNGLSPALWQKLKLLLLDERNVCMAARIAKLARQQSLFVAVGAAHLPGQGGIIERLQQAGFKVELVRE